MKCCPICHFCYNRHLSRCPFLSSLCKYLLAKFAIFAKFVMVLIASYQHALFCHLIWIFGQTFDEFWPPPRHFCWNLPLANISLLVTHLICGFARPLMDSWPIPHFLKFAIFEKIATVIMLVLLFHLHFLPDLQWILCQIRKICHFRKTHNYRHASFVILLKFLPNLSCL